MLYRESKVCTECGMTETEYDDTDSQCHLRLPHTWFVPVEATDRVCRTHNYWMDIGETICDVRWMDNTQKECNTFDVVRVEE
jgi:hypothetical protein